jgi:hypothetical protein
MHHNAEAVLKAHSARTTKLCSQRNVQLEATVMWKVPSSRITFILLLASYVNNACQDVNALPKAQYILRDALQVLTVQMAQISVSLALKVLIAARLIQLRFLRLS